MKASIFFALIIGVIIGVVGTFGGLYATGSLSTDNSKQRVVARNNLGADLVEDKGTGEANRPEVVPSTIDKPALKEDDISHKLEPCEPSDVTEPTEVEADGVGIDPVLEYPESIDEAHRKASSNGLRRLEDGSGIPEGFDADEIGGMLFGGIKIDLDASLAGTVVDSNGLPISNAKVYATYSEKINSSRGMSVAIAGLVLGGEDTPIATTDASGNWTAQISRKVSEKSKLRVSLTAKSDSFADSKNESVTVKNGDSKEGINLILRGAGSATGYVRDQSGAGVEGISVSLNKGQSGLFGGGFIMPGSGGGLSGKTDSSGFFRISNVPEGSYMFRIKAAGVREVSGPKEVTIAAGVETSAPVDFVVAKTTALRLKMVDEEGRALIGYVTVEVIGTNGELVKSMNGMVNKEGTVTLNDPPIGTYNVEVVVWGYDRAIVFCDFQENQIYDAGTVTFKESEFPPVPSGILPK